MKDMSIFNGPHDLNALTERLAASDAPDTSAHLEAKGPEPRKKSDPSSWNPPFCGMIDMEIRRDGRWFYQGSPITRPALVALFASVLRREGDDYLLVTPVEKVGIKVEDLPFLAVEMIATGSGENQSLRLRNALDQWVEVGPAHPLRFDRLERDGLAPAVLWRDGLWARLSRPLSHQLADLGSVKAIDGTDWFGVFSHGEFFPMIEAAALDQA
jgi:hypothetical protein